MIEHDHSFSKYFKNRLTYMNTNKIINSTIISLFIVLLTFLAIVFLVRINLYESYVFQKQDQKIQVNLTQDSQLAKFIQNNKAKYLIGYYKMTRVLLSS